MSSLCSGSRTIGLHVEVDASDLSFCDPRLLYSALIGNSDVLCQVVLSSFLLAREARCKSIMLGQVPPKLGWQHPFAKYH